MGSVSIHQYGVGKSSQTGVQDTTLEAAIDVASKAILQAASEAQNPEKPEGTQNVAEGGTYRLCDCGQIL